MEIGSFIGYRAQMNALWISIAKILIMARGTPFQSLPIGNFKGMIIHNIQT